MFDLIGNLKELKNLSISKVLVFSSFVVLILGYVKHNMPGINKDFLKTLSFFSKKFDFNEWKSILLIIQVISAGVVIVLFIVYLLSLIIFATYWNKQSNAPILRGIRKEWVQSKLPVYSIISCAIYLNLIGYYAVFEIEPINYQIPIIISTVVILSASLAFFGKYIIQNYDEY
ncbi:hypothetical protein MKZ15_05720 [Paenibacillus sp. FSL R7-0216]|uniref:hypothetical protein n=1 Tax=Paenibacillus sp. FSL R7-0216 TaxID=2921677 RepID=UPI0030DA0D1B